MNRRYPNQNSGTRRTQGAATVQLRENTMVLTVTLIMQGDSLSRSVRDLIAEGGYSLASDEFLPYEHEGSGRAASSGLNESGLPFMRWKEQPHAGQATLLGHWRRRTHA